MGNWCLLVDDNSVNLMIVANMMKSFDINIDEALSGAEAIRMAGEKEYDIIFMDYLMPELNGIDTTREIRKWSKGKKAAVIALTANVTDEIVSEFIANGANDVTAKPMSRDSLDAIMEKWVPYVGKNTVVAKKQETVEEEKNLEWLWEKLKGISMDVKHGAFSFSGDPVGYYRILSASVRNLKDSLWHLKELEKLTLWLEMRLEFHSMKGILANLGVMDLSVKCGEIENFASEGNTEQIKNLAPELMEEIDGFASRFQEILKEWRQEEENLGKEVRQVSRSEWIEILEALKESLRNFEINNVEEYFQKLSSSAGEKDSNILRRANSAMQNFQYIRALEILGEIETADMPSAE